MRLHLQHTGSGETDAPARRGRGVQTGARGNPGQARPKSREGAPLGWGATSAPGRVVGAMTADAFGPTRRNGSSGGSFGDPACWQRRNFRWTSTITIGP